MADQGLELVLCGDAGVEEEAKEGMDLEATGAVRIGSACVCEKGRGCQRG